MQYLEIQIVTGNALCVPKDETLNESPGIHIHVQFMGWCVACVYSKHMQHIYQD